jgi:hypothetical protein
MAPKCRVESELFVILCSVIENYMETAKRQRLQRSNVKKPERDRDQKKDDKKDLIHQMMVKQLHCLKHLFASFV